MFDHENSDLRENEQMSEIGRDQGCKDSVYSFCNRHMLHSQLYDK